MKLFIWHNPYQVKYGHSMVFVVAETLDEAKKQAADGFIYRFGYKQQNKGTFLAEKLDEPDRVLELPCAEWHEWQE